jgi:transposase
MNGGKKEMTGDQERGRVIGLDMHPDSFTAAALEGASALDAQVLWVHDNLPQVRLEGWLGKHVGPRDLIVIEASGNTFHTVDRIRACGRNAVVLEPLRASQVRKAYCTTDKISAVKLARVYFSGLAVEVWTPDDKTRERREVLHAHRRAVQDTTRGRNRIRSWLNQFGIRRRKGLRLTRESGRDWVLAQREWAPTQRMLVNQMFEDLWQAEERRKQLRQVMAEEVGSDPELLKLNRLFGLHIIGAYGLAAIIGDIHRFRTPRKLAAYLGFSPNINRSGLGKHDGGSSPWGCGEVRRILIQSAKTILRFDNKTPLHRWGLALACRKGRNLAAFAVARKLVTAVWYLLKGFFTPLTEDTPILRRKLFELAQEIGKDRIRELGFAHSGDFRDRKMQVLLETT